MSKHRKNESIASTKTFIFFHTRLLHVSKQFEFIFPLYLLIKKEVCTVFVGKHSGNQVYKGETLFQQREA